MNEKVDTEATSPSSTSDKARPDSTPSLSSPKVTTEKEEPEDDGLVECFKYLSIEKEHYHFLGRSSYYPLIRTAVDMKHQAVQSEGRTPRGYTDPDTLFPSRRPEFWRLDYVSLQ